MAKFLTGNELNSELGKIFEEAYSQLILISPFIKLHDRYLSSLLTKKNDHTLEIIVVFGKNEEDKSKSMKENDFNFFKEFPNIKICFEKRLHAKYYANESAAILTSMNLYSYSQDNNIEAGVLVKSSLLGSIATNLLTNVAGADNFDVQAWNYFKRVFDQSEMLFKKTPQYESTMLGLSKRYSGSIIEVDKLSDFFNDKSRTERKATNQEIPIIKQNSAPKINTEVRLGYCIRTAKPIPFDTKQPFCDEALKSWNKYRNEEFPEKYCHFSGENSNGETNKARPILRKNWNEAKKFFKL